MKDCNEGRVLREKHHLQLPPQKDNTCRKAWPVFSF